MAIIGISGRAGSGKDTVGKIIQELTANRVGFNLVSSYNWEIKKFAHKLKQIVSILTGICIEDLEKEEIKNSRLSKEWCYDSYGKPFLEQCLYKHINKDSTYTYRELLQRVGTEAMRNTIHPDIWVNALFNDYKQIIGYAPGNYYNTCGNCNKQFVGDKKAVRCKDCSVFYKNWIITDVRFQNEAEAILERQGLLFRINRPLLNQEVHVSEVSLDNYEKFTEAIENNGSVEELTQKIKTVLQKYKII